ncbi:MAG TPA: inorganic diphosphatase [Anaerolinea sp.]|nr:inorganic diphosphatase [Anaerolinea sp.]
MRSLDIAREYLGKHVRLTIDRPMGSHHPQHGFLYPVNYGYLPGVAAPDGDDLDAYLLGVDHPVEHFTGICIAIIHRLDDDDDKLVVVPAGCFLDDDQIRTQTVFQEQFFTSEVLRI